MSFLGLGWISVAMEIWRLAKFYVTSFQDFSEPTEGFTSRTTLVKAAIRHEENILKF